MKKDIRLVQTKEFDVYRKNVCLGSVRRWATGWFATALDSAGNMYVHGLTGSPHKSKSGAIRAVLAWHKQ